MIHGCVELHNVAEVLPLPAGGARLLRAPESLRAAVNETAQMRLLQPDNCEVRFVCDWSKPAYVTVSSEGQTGAELFYGCFDARERWTIGREPTTLRIAPGERIRRLDRRWWADMPFAPCVRRIIFGGRRRDPVILHGVAGEGIRPPTAEELPPLRYLVYGTSITHGFDCEGPHLSYAAQTAWHLGADLINLGVGGACHCEQAFADYIASRDDWHVASLALSVNMQHFPMDEFRRRVGYMVRTVAAADTSRPVACITLWPFYRDFGIEDAGAACGGTPGEYRQALRDAVADCNLPNLTLLEGPQLLTNIAGLTGDLIHPSDNAMIEMGRNLAERLQPLVARPAR